MMDIVHFQDLSLTCHETDPHLFFYISYDAFQLFFPWLRKVEARVASYAPTQNSGSEQLGPNPGYGVSFWTPTQVGN